MKFWMLLLVLAAGMVLAKIAGLPDKLQGYHGWVRVNIGKVTATGAHSAVKDVYVNTSLAGLLAADGKYRVPFASGVIFVKERMDPDTLSVTTLYVMEKKSAKEGDWEWSVFEREGNGFKGGVLANPAMCVGCHQQAKDSDWVYTQVAKR
jgi:hypothetical protein